MYWEKVCIEALGHDLPERVVTSAEIEDMLAPTLDRLGVERGKLERISGVRERRWYDPAEKPSDIATRSARRALDKAGLTGSDLDMVISTSVTRDYDEPATATLIGGNLGVPHSAFTYDVSHACLGFVAGMVQAANALELGQAEHVLVVSGENPVAPMITDIERLQRPDVTPETFRRTFATLTLGSGGVAAVMSRRDVSRSGHLVQGAVPGSACEHNDLCIGVFGEGMVADTRGLLVHGAALIIELWPRAVEVFGWGPDDIDHFICHQVSLAHFAKVFETLGQDLGKAYLTLPYLGNCASASLPITLAIAEAEGVLHPGEQLCFYAAGSGLGAIIMSVRW